MKVADLPVVARQRDGTTTTGGHPFAAERISQRLARAVPRRPDVTVLAVARRYGPSWHRVMVVWCWPRARPVTAGAARAAVRRWLPNARHVVDRFHVARDLAKVLVSARRGPPRTPGASPTTRSCLATAFRS